QFHAVRRQDGAGGTIQVLNGPEELGRWFVRLQHQARAEMLVLDRPPYALAPTNPVEPTSLHSGVQWRAIYAPEALETPGACQAVEALGLGGEQSRVLAGLPMKLASADRRTALLPLHLEVEHAQAVVIWESTLLTALLALFDEYWKRALPIGDPGDPTDDDPQPDRELAQLLASGLSDNAAARQLGISTRTIGR